MKIIIVKNCIDCPFKEIKPLSPNETGLYCVSRETGLPPILIGSMDTESICKGSIPIPAWCPLGEII